MNKRHDRLSSLFLELRSLPAEQRAEALERARATAPDIAAEVESMLRHEGDPPPVLRTGWPGAHASQAAVPPEHIGPYRVVARLGSGGMGEVFLAEQGDPLPRQVAVKIIRSGAWHGSALARFQTERHALARMDHPNIARVFDAGAMPGGDPYFAMEFIDGLSITEYCDRKQLPVAERLGLFLQVCAGVQHAHQRAIVHRDLKPANVLITTAAGQPTPKIIDFGVAKPLDDAAQASAADRTGHGSLLGTPSYMSPEQAASTAPAIDTRTDVYSLGALLYELLCGEPPVDLKGVDPLDIDELRRCIRETRPQPPSRRVSSRAAQRALAGDLDRIVMKAIARDPEARYGSVVELAADVRRHLDHEPVLASSAGRMYRLRKTLRRNRTAALIAGAVAMLLIAFSTVAFVQARRALAAKRQTERVSAYLSRLPDITAQSDFFGDVTRREYLNHGESLARSMTDFPRQRANLRLSLAGLRARAGDLDRARQLYDLAAEDIQVLHAADPLLLLRQQVTAALLAGLEGDLNAADKSLRELVDSTEGVQDPEALRIRHDAMRTLSRLHGDVGRRDHALDILRILTHELAETRSADDLDLLVALGYQAAIELDAGNPERCVEILQDAQPRMDEALGPRHPATRVALFNLSVCSDRAGHVDEALVFLDEAVERGLDIGYKFTPELAMIAREGFEAIHDRFKANRAVDKLGSWAAVYIRIGQFDRAMLALEAHRDATRRVYGTGTLSYPWVAMEAAAAPALVGRFAEAEARLTELLEFHAADDRFDDPSLEAEVVWKRAQCRVGLDDVEGARALVQHSLDLCIRLKSSCTHWARAGLSSLDRDREGVYLHVRSALESQTLTAYSPERDIVFEWLRDDPEFLRIVESGRHPFLF